jgi:exosortase A
MPLDALQPTRAPLVEALAPHWRRPLGQLALLCAALLALFAPTWAAMAWKWWDSSTYNHVLLVPPIMGWLVWQRAADLAKLTPKAWWPGLIPLVGGLVLWLLGDISGLATAAQMGAVVMLQSAVLLVLGPRVCWAVLFPLCYALFLVPLGEELVPLLQLITAKLTIWLTVASGIPAEINGVFIDTPVGLFEVAEACSGVKFLVAMVALGTLVAHLCFRSWWRRAGFMVVAVVLPVLANGVRAWGTIYIAQGAGIEFAAGFDHIFYGWVFFALVMAALLGMSWRFFDRHADDRFVDPETIAAARWLDRVEAWNAAGWRAVAVAAGLALLTLGWAHGARAVEAALPQALAVPHVPGWTPVTPQHAYPWQPRMAGADRKLTASFRDAEGREVDVVFALYAAQSEGREAGAYGEGALVPDSEWRWLEPAPPIDGALGDRLLALGLHQRTAMTWYRHDGWTGGSRSRLKLYAMRDALLLRPRTTMTLIVSAEQREGQDAAGAIEAFLASAGPTGAWMDRIAGLD